MNQDLHAQATLTPAKCYRQLAGSLDPVPSVSFAISETEAFTNLLMTSEVAIFSASLLGAFFSPTLPSLMSVPKQESNLGEQFV